MARWSFEPGHTAAEFCVRHMMVTWVRGAFKDVHGTLEFDPDDQRKGAVEIEIDARLVWSGEADRDAHLKNAYFLDADNHPHITFRGETTESIGPDRFKVTGDLTIRGVARRAELDVSFLGHWDTPWWEDGEDKGPKRRAGFQATTEINRHDYGVSWNGDLERGGVVVGDRVFITIDAEAILDD